MGIGWQIVAGGAGILALFFATWAGSNAWRRARTMISPALRRRPSLVECGWTLSVEPESVRLEVRAGPLAWPAVAFVVAAGWLLFGLPFVRPLLDRIGAAPDPRGRDALDHGASPINLWHAAVFAVVGVQFFAHALRRTVVILEAAGDLRVTTRGLLGTEEWTVSPGAFDALHVRSPGQVLLRWRPAPGAPLEHRAVFMTARMPELDLWADVNAASVAFHELSRRRAAPG